MVCLHVHTATHAVRQTLRLLKYLLQHEVGIASFLDLAEVDVDSLYLQVLLLTEDAHHMKILSTTDHGNVTILKIDHLVGIFHDWTGVGTQEELILTDTHNERALLSGGNDLIGVVLVEHGDGVGTNHLIQGNLYGSQQIQMLMLLDVFNQLHQHLGIGIAHKVYTLCLQFLLQVGVVLDDAIVDDGQILRLGVMWMGISR